MNSVHVIIDNSGSMRENGKAGLASGLLAVMRRQEALTGVPFSFYKWGQEVQPVRTPRDLDFSGQTEEDALISFLSDQEPAAVLLVSDGGISRSVARALKRAGAACIAVGCDSGLDTLDRLLGEDNVFPLADCMTCIYILASKCREL